MKVVECCPFFNENLIAGIKIEEARKWVDELHITECDKSHKYGNKPYLFDFADNPLIHYHKINGSVVFKKSHWSISSKPLFIKRQSYFWENEGTQRNLACSYMDIDDDDIVILSDLDEIIDNRYVDKIIHETRKRGIITIKLHFTMFYFNLFSKNWGGPPNYSYRTFVLTGRYFKSMGMSSNQLRKLGEHGKLMTTVHCLEDIAGFHHSWIGDAQFVTNKLTSYAHDIADHDTRVCFADGCVNVDYIRECIEEKRSIFGQDHELYVDNDITLLESVQKLKNSKTTDYFL